MRFGGLFVFVLFFISSKPLLDFLHDNSLLSYLKEKKKVVAAWEDMPTASTLKRQHLSPSGGQHRLRGTSAGNRL